MCAGWRHAWSNAWPHWRRPILILHLNSLSKGFIGIWYVWPSMRTLCRLSAPMAQITKSTSTDEIENPTIAPRLIYLCIDYGNIAQFTQKQHVFQCHSVAHRSWCPSSFWNASRAHIPHIKTYVVLYKWKHSSLSYNIKGLMMDG